MPTAQSAASACHRAVRARFEQFILAQDHPCVMAQTVFRMDHVAYHYYDYLADEQQNPRILCDLGAYLDAYDFTGRTFYTFLAIFKREPTLSEVAFEQKLWAQLQGLHDIDTAPWDATVSADPADGSFSMSLASKAFYVVGLHPGASRAARRSPYAAIAFNLHRQFEELRSMGAYHVVRDKIRKRDVQRNGSYNPMMEDFGTGSSEAKQYSGRQVDKSWRCPFRYKKSA